MKRLLICLALPAVLLTSCRRAGGETVVAETTVGVREIVTYAVVTATDTALLTAEKGAVVAEVFAEAGDRVAQGDPLLTVSKNKETATLTAAAPGIVAEIAAAGAASDGKRPLCTLMDTRRLTVTPLLTEGDAAAVSPGDGATVTALSSGRSYPAVLIKTSALPEADDGRYRARLELDNVDGLLLPGMTVKVTLSSQREGVMLPHTAVGYDESGYYACAEDGDRVRLLGAVYCTEGYLVTGIEPGRTVARFAERVAP